MTTLNRTRIKPGDPLPVKHIRFRQMRIWKKLKDRGWKAREIADKAGVNPDSMAFWLKPSEYKKAEAKYDLRCALDLKLMALYADLNINMDDIGVEMNMSKDTVHERAIALGCEPRKMRLSPMGSSTRESLTVVNQWIADLDQKPGLSLKAYAESIDQKHRTLVSAIQRALVASGLSYPTWLKQRFAHFENIVCQDFKNNLQVPAIVAKYDSKREIIKNILRREGLLQRTRGRGFHREAAHNIEWVYFLRLDFLKQYGTSLKVGRTFTTIEERFRYSHDIKTRRTLGQWPLPHVDAYRLEETCKEYFASFQRLGPKTFSGFTECFLDDIVVEDGMRDFLKTAYVVLVQERQRRLLINSNDYSLITRSEFKQLYDTFKSEQAIIKPLVEWNQTLNGKRFWGLYQGLCLIQALEKLKKQTGEGETTTTQQGQTQEASLQADQQDVTSTEGQNQAMFNGLETPQQLSSNTDFGLLKIAARNVAYKSNGKKLVSKKRNQPVVAFGHSFPSLTVASDKLKVLYNALLSEKGATYAREKIPTFSRDCLSRRLKNTNDPSVVKPLTPLHPLRPEKDSFNSQFFSEAAKSPTKTPNDKFSDTKTSLGQLPSPPENPSFTENEVNALPKTPESELSRFVSKDNENLPSVPTSGWPNPTLSSVPSIEPVDSSSGPTEAGFASLTFVAVETIVSTETAVLACNVIVGVFTRTSVLLLALPWQVMGYSLSSLSIIINALGQRTPIFWGVISIQVYPVACCLCSNAFLCLSIPPSLFALAYLLHKKKLGCGQFVKGPDIYAYLIWGVQSVVPTLDKTLVVSPFYSTSVALFGSISLTRLHIITLRMIRWAWLLAWKTTLDAVLVSKQNSKRDFALTHKTQMMDEKPFFKPVTSVQKPSYDVLFVFMFREDG